MILEPSAVMQHFCAIVAVLFFYSTLTSAAVLRSTLAETELYSANAAKLRDYQEAIQYVLVVTRYAKSTDPNLPFRTENFGLETFAFAFGSRTATSASTISIASSRR